MKRLYLSMFLLIFCAMISVPVISVKNPPTKKVRSEAVVKQKTTAPHTDKTEKSTQKVEKEQYFSVYITDKKRVEKISLSEYLLGVLACEMDESYPTEALKAQAVAAHTLLLYRKAENSDKNYDITDSYKTDQGYYTYEKRKEKYKASLPSLEKLLKQAVSEVKDEIIYYKNKPILAVYHDTSGGKTENADEIWGGSYPYLKSVDSISDMLNPNFLSKVYLTKKQFCEKLKSIGGSLPKKTAYIGKTETTASGTVKNIVIGGKKYGGSKIREVFGLKSSNFDLKYEDKQFKFTVRGFGHGVGMSQYGAYYMAKEGSNYRQILKWYYTDCQIK